MPRFVGYENFDPYEERNFSHICTITEMFCTDVWFNTSTIKTSVSSNKGQYFIKLLH